MIPLRKAYPPPVSPSPLFFEDEEKKREAYTEYKAQYMEFLIDMRRMHAANFVIGYMNLALQRCVATSSKDAGEYAKELVHAGLGAYTALNRALDDLK